MIVACFAACFNVNKLTKSKRVVYTVRLAGSISSHEGRLEVYRYDRWGTVCNRDGFTDAEATVVCRSIGFRYVQTRNFSLTTNSVLMSHVEDNISKGFKMCNPLARPVSDPELG